MYSNKNICLISILALFFSTSQFYGQEKLGNNYIKKNMFNGKIAEYVDRQILVKFKDVHQIKNAEGILEDYKAKIIGKCEELNWVLADLPENVNIMEAIPQIKKIGLIETAEPNYVMRTHFEPNDQYFTEGKQWALKNVGQIPPSGTNDADIDAPEAWDITKGTINTKIAIIDTGIPLSLPSLALCHPDLSNQSKIQLGIDCIDLEGSVEYLRGVRDASGHGTHVAGIIGADANNGIGIAGLANGCKLLIVQSINASGIGTGYSFLSAVQYAVNNGAKIINFSGGYASPGSGEITAYNDALEYADNNNVLVVVSAGNENSGGVTYPANLAPYYSNVISVTATDHNDIFASYSSQGAEVCVSAPGGNGLPNNDGNDIYSTTPNYSFALQNSPYYVTQEYGYLFGTSMAAPHVSAIAGLILSINPNLYPYQIKDIIQQSAEDKGVTGRDNYYGYGRVNAYKALKYTIENYGGTFNQNVTLPAGDTWNLQAGVTLTFASDCALIVNGTLNAVGNSTSRITFTRSGTSNWGGIQFNSGSSGNIQYCTIQYGNNGIYCYNSSPTIRYNDIEYSTSTGLYCNYYSSPVVVGNNFRFNGQYGVRCDSYSSPNLTDNGNSGANVIRNNGVGLFGNYYSNPNLAGYLSTGNSIFDNNGWEVAAFIYSTINAQKVYWGNGATIYTTGGSTIDNSNPLPDNPNPGRNIVADNSPNSVTGEINLKVIGDDLNSALYKQKDKKYDEAITLFLEVFKNNIDALLGKYALSKIEECFTQAGKKDYLDYSKREIKTQLKEGGETYVEVLELETHQMVNLGLYKGAINTLQTILKKYTLNEAIEKNTLFSLGAFHNIFLGDKVSSDKYFEELKQKYPKDELVNQIEIIKGFDLAANSSVQGGVVALPFEETAPVAKVTVSEDAITNYPNPFNPSTKISFTLKEGGKVSLKVYDVLGKEVANLAEGYYEAGKHVATFDGSNLSSGIYFYRLVAPTAIITKKMVLTK